MIKRMNQMELEDVARQGRKEQTDMVVSTLTSSITKKKQIVSQKIKRGLPGLVSRVMEDGGEGHGDQAGWVGEQAGQGAGHQPVHGGHRMAVA